ncbi:TIGR04282 family arsenosugar biosynthesis glycosyltransferase [Salinarimonas soli]|nr:TIGR04282 family arsenosugar biosynthesis glycosyltransferase [Salinarimonas soli]
MSSVAVLAKAPVPGFAKTRLIPRLGAEGAADLQARLTERAVATALAAGIGPVTLWCAPETSHPAFLALAQQFGVTLRVQPEGDIGRRMLAAFEATAGPLVLIGTDCPVLRPDDLRASLNAVEGGADAAFSPAEDGGYGLVAAARALPALFEGVPWSTGEVMSETRARAAEAALSLALLDPVWDVDMPQDYDRLVASGLMRDRRLP